MLISAYLTSALVLLFGLIIGSFLNCLIWRLHTNQSLGGRSHCPHCKKLIAWYDNIPVVSYLLLGGRCRKCRSKISWQYPAVEIATSLLFLLSFLSHYGQAPLAGWLARDWLIISALIVVFVYDLRWQMVPMYLIWPMTAAVFIINLVLGVPLIALILSASLCAFFFLLQYVLTNGKGLGQGDIWIGLLLGCAFYNLSELFLVILLAYGLGALIGASLIFMRRKEARSKVPLGPFLAAGAIITLIWGERIIGWYISLFA